MTNILYINMMSGGATYETNQSTGGITTDINGGNYGLAWPGFDNTQYVAGNTWFSAANLAVLTKTGPTTAGWIVPTQSSLLPTANVSGVSTYDVGSEIVVAVSINFTTITINLPNFAQLGRYIIVTDVNGTSPTHNIIINGNGHNISSFSVSTTSISTAFASKMFVFGGQVWNEIV